MKPAIEDVDFKRMASQLREVADELEAGKFVVFAVVACGPDGESSQCCMVDTNSATDELLDEMCYAVKQMLFDSLEAGK